MLNAVDINQFLANESSKSTARSISQLITDALAVSRGTSQLVAQETVNRRLGLYCLGVSTTVIGLFDSNNGKKFVFAYDVDTDRVAMNERRAQSKEIKFFVHRLNQLAQIGRVTPHVIGVHADVPGPFPEGLSEPLLQRLSPIFHCELPLQWQRLASSHTPPLARLLNRLVQQFNATLSDSANRDTLDALFEYAQKVIESQALKNDDCVLVSNQSRLNPATNWVYSMYIYTDSVVIQSKRGSQTSRIDIHLAAKKVTLDQNELKANAADWVMTQFKKIAWDISSGMAQIYESVGLNQ